MANCNFSLCTVDHVGNIFQKIFPDSKIVASFSLSRTSASYKISEGLVPYFKKTIVEDLPFSIHSIVLPSHSHTYANSLNTTKRERKTTVTAMWNFLHKLQPQLDASSVQDKWKLFQADADVSTQDIKKVVEDYWNVVLQLKSVEGINCYPFLQLVVKASLILAQTNAEPERSLFINAHLIPKNRASLGQPTNVGLCAVKLQNIPKLKLSVRSAHAVYQVRKRSCDWIKSRRSRARKIY